MAKTKAPEKLVKEKFCDILRNRGFKEVTIKRDPADIYAEFDGEPWWFELKSTVEPKRCWGSSTETEWKKALENPDHFRFVVIWTTSQLKKFEYEEYTPEQFMKFCHVDPFIVSFNIPYKPHIRNEHKSFEFNKEVFGKLHGLYDEFRKKNSQ